MAVPYTFGTATSSIPLSQLDSNFATVITLGNTAIQLGNTVTTLNNMTLANVTISSGNVTITNVAITTANVTTANITTAVIGTETVTTSTITTANVTTANITTGNITNGTVITSLTLSYGTANGVTYLNGSKVLTSGSALTFDGTNFATTGSISSTIASKTAQFNAAGGSIYASFADGTKTWRFGAGIQSAGTISLYNATDAVTAYTVDATGNVGIGTTSPTTRLTISGTETINTATDATAGLIVKTFGTSGGIQPIANFQRSDAAINMQIGYEGTNGDCFFGTTTNHNLYFISNNTERMRIDSSGNVGIGTTSPTLAKLQISQTSNTAGAIYALAASGQNGNAYAFGISGVSNGYQITNDGSNNIAHIWSGTGGNERMRIDSSGNVGIGINSPSNKLVVSNAGAAGFEFDPTNGIMQTYNRSGAAYTTTNILASSINLKTGASPATTVIIDSAGIVTMSAYGAGAATFSAAGVISSVSDETWKIKDGVPVDPDSMLKKLEPGYWYYNDEKKEIFGVDRQLGFYAQNVNAAIGPEAAPTPEEGKPWGYYDRSVLAVTVMSLQKALATIESLTARITALEST